MDAFFILRYHENRYASISSSHSIKMKLLNGFIQLHFHPKTVSSKTVSSVAGQRSKGGGPEGWGRRRVGPREVGAPKGGGPKISRFFFHLPPHFPSRGILVVFEAPGP